MIMTFLKSRIHIGSAACLTALALSFAGSPTAHAAKGPGTRHSSATGACTDSESWSFSSAIYSKFQKDFRTTLSAGQSPAKGFSEGLALRRLADTAEAKIFGEYWISRALLQAGLKHIAYNGFTVIAARPVRKDTFGIQTAALECMGRIFREYPSFRLPENVNVQLPAYLKGQTTPHGKQVVYEYAGHLLREKVEQAQPKSEISFALSVLKGSGYHEDLAEGIYAAYRKDYAKTAERFEAFLATPALPSHMRRFDDYIHMMLARAYFTLLQYEKAVVHYKKVRKHSNELAAALSELSWSYLMDDKYNEAIGTGINLHQGGLRQTFAPEAPMVMAMALNELCHFPESLRAINLFKKNYEKPFRWLDGWYSAGPSKRPPLYPLAVQYLRKQGTVPQRVASEWIRSPLFLSRQEEINLLFGEKQGTAKLGRNGAQEQRRLGAELQAFSTKLRQDIVKARTKMKPGDALPQAIASDVLELKQKLTHYRRFRRAAPVWRTILASFQRQAAPTERRLVAEINRDLARTSERMYHQLIEIAENNQLIEVEIYNGASQDII